MSPWSPQSNLARVVVAAGFVYDPSQDIIVSTLHPWQRGLGYTWAYDVAAAPSQMIIDCEPFYFSYGGKLWLIELWKGQYGFETGCEIGVYRDDIGRGMTANPRSRFFASVPDAEMLRMTSTLRRDGDARPLFCRGPERHWWLTGFRWGVFTENTRNLSMTVEIDFSPKKDMCHAFTEAAEQIGYRPHHPTPTTVAFTFHHPRTLQPGSRGTLEGGAQARNQIRVTNYQLYKKAKGISTNDPNAFTDDAAPPEFVHVAKAAAAQVHHAASTAARRLGHTTAATTKIHHHVAAAAATLRSEAAGAALKLHGELADDAGAASQAYDEVLSFFDRKVWHVPSR